MMKKKKTGWIILAIILVIAGIAAGAIGFMTNGLERNQALDIAEVSAKDLANGVYEGSYGSGRWQNDVFVTVEDGQILDIELTKHVLFERPEITDELMQRVLQEQTTCVDTISGATVTCNEIGRAHV